MSDELTKEEEKNPDFSDKNLPVIILEEESEKKNEMVECQEGKIEESEKNDRSESFESSQKEKKLGLKSKIFLFTIFGLIIAFAVFLALNTFLYLIQKNSFRSFDLDLLKSQGLVIQTIEFKKFIVHGTGKNTGGRVPSAYTDELEVFHVSGTAEIAFEGMEKLSINEDDSDYEHKILRLKYSSSEEKTPFSVNVRIQEKDIQKVASFESKKIDFMGLKKDLIKPDMSQAQIVEAVKKELQKEFYEQILGKGENPNLSELEVYQSFLARLTEIVRSTSDWQSVEVDF